MVINTRIRHHSLNNVSGNNTCSEYGFGFWYGDGSGDGDGNC